MHQCYDAVIFCLMWLIYHTTYSHIFLKIWCKMLYFFLLQHLGGRFWRRMIAARWKLWEMPPEKTPNWTGCTSSRPRKTPSAMINVWTAVFIRGTIKSTASLTNRDPPLFVRFQNIFSNNYIWETMILVTLVIFISGSHFALLYWFQHISYVSHPHLWQVFLFCLIFDN